MLPYTLGILPSGLWLFRNQIGHVFCICDPRKSPEHGVWIPAWYLLEGPCAPASQGNIESHAYPQGSSLDLISSCTAFKKSVSFFQCFRAQGASGTRKWNMRPPPANATPMSITRSNFPSRWCPKWFFPSRDSLTHHIQTNFPNGCSREHPGIEPGKSHRIGVNTQKAYEVGLARCFWNDPKLSGWRSPWKRTRNHDLETPWSRWNIGQLGAGGACMIEKSQDWRTSLGHQQHI